MSAFDQGFFDFNAQGSDAGWKKWREELETKQREFESRWGVVLHKRVTVFLRDFAKPVSGRLEWLNQNERHAVPRFRIGTLEFGHEEIESIAQENAE